MNVSFIVLNLMLSTKSPIAIFTKYSIIFFVSSKLSVNPYFTGNNNSHDFVKYSEKSNLPFIYSLPRLLSKESTVYSCFRLLIIIFFDLTEERCSFNESIIIAFQKSSILNAGLLLLKIICLKKSVN